MRLCRSGLICWTVELLSIKGGDGQPRIEPRGDRMAIAAHRASARARIAGGDGELPQQPACFIGSRGRQESRGAVASRAEV